MFQRRAQFALLALAMLGAVSLGGGLAYAQVPDVNIPDVNVDVPIPDVNVHVNPDVPSASEINCQIYAELIAKGEPIPPGFDASGCDGGNDGGGGGDGGNGGGSGGNGGSDGGSGGGGDSSTGGSGGSTGGNSGGPAPACEDNIDNDGDGLKDMNDPGCSSPSDTDESNTSGGGGGGDVATSTAATSSEEVSATSTLPVVASCDMYLTAFIKPGAKNDAEQVMRLQSLLNESEDAALAVNGEYDAQTIAAVHAFQMKYASDILAPWGATKSTGFVYLTTKKKVNEIYCKMTKEFPLTNEEVQTIAKTKSQISGSVTAPRGSATTPKPASTEVTPVNENEVGSAAKESQTAAAGESATRSLNRLWDPVRNFFGRVFGR